MKLETKIVVAIGVAFAAVAGTTLVLLRVAAERNVAVVAADTIRGAGNAFAAMERADVEKLDSTLHALMTHPGLAEAFAARDRERLLSIAAPIFAGLRREHDVTHFYFLDPEPKRTCFLRVHKPTLHGDVVNRITYSNAIEARGRGAGKELGQTAFALRVVEPWVIDGKLVGYAELGEEIDHFLGRIKAQTGDEYGLLVEKKYLDAKTYANTRVGMRNNWDDMTDVVVVDRTSPDDSIFRFDGDLAAVPETGLLIEEVRRAGRRLARGLVPVLDASGRRVGALFVLHDITALHENVLQARTMVMWAVGSLAVLLAVVLRALVRRLVFARLARMIVSIEDASTRLVGGDHDVVVPAAAGPRDEIGEFEEFLGRFLGVVAGLLKDLTRRKSG